LKTTKHLQQSLRRDESSSFFHSEIQPTDCSSLNRSVVPVRFAEMGTTVEWNKNSHSLQAPTTTTIGLNYVMLTHYLRKLIEVSLQMMIEISS
jgi:hypothetical protein